MLFVSLFIGASGDHNAKEKPLESYKETGSEEEKNEKPVPDVSLNEGMLYSLLSLLQISSTSMLHGKILG